MDMTQEEKSLLLQDLCARLPYGVKVWHFGTTRELLGIISSTENVMVGYDINDYEDSVIEDIKPYLRPMLSMTDEERKEYYHFVAFSGSPNGSANFVNWLNAHHFDYRGLIEKGLAIKAPKGMYD